MQTLSQLRLINIATLDACMNHFTRLIDLTSADEPYITSLATIFGPCILRPRTETSLTLEEKHPYRLVRDLFAHKDAIFSELKRLSTATAPQNPDPSVTPTEPTSSPRPRAISTDESNREANMKERNRLLLEKASNARGRATSPAPGSRHRRDRSTGGPETRFPVNVNASPVQRTNRASLGVPDADDKTVSPPDTPPQPAKRSSTPIVDKRSSAIAVDGVGSTGVEKRNSLGRSGARLGGGTRRVPHGREGHVPSSSLASLSMGDDEVRGVTLEDKPMDD